MRQFTLANSYHDNDGNLLHGRISFYKKGTTTLEDIFDVDGHVLSNPIYTNSIGQTRMPVFLADKDYTIVFDSYQGSGVMEEDTEDPTNWVFQYSAVSLFETYDVTVDLKGIEKINTVQELRETSPEDIVSEEKVIVLAGYNEAGDKPSINYVWDPDSMAADDGGATIKVDDIATGRWVMVEQSVGKLDVRHYGVFPAESYNNIPPVQPLRIGNAYRHASATGSNLFFPIVNSASFYLVSQSLYGIAVANGTHICVDRNVTIEIAENPLNFLLTQTPDYNGTCTIVGEELAYSRVTAFGGAAVDYSSVIFQPRSKFRIDKNVEYTLELKGVEVFLEGTFTRTNSYMVTLEDCNIHANNKIRTDMHMTFKNCIILESMFYNSNDLTNCTFIDCFSDISYWSSVRRYMDYWNKSNTVFLDLKGRAIDRAISINRGVIIKNVNGGSIELLSTCDVCSVSNSTVFISSQNPSVPLNIDSSNVSLLSENFGAIAAADSVCTVSSDLTEVTVADFGAKNSAFVRSDGLTSGGITVTNTFSMEHCNFTCHFDVRQCQVPMFKDCNVTGMVRGKYISMVECTIASQVITEDNNGEINFDFARNTFTSGSHVMEASQANTIVVGRWVNNTALLQHPIGFDRANFNSLENMHPYTYEGNTGKFLKNHTVKKITGIIDGAGAGSSISQPGCIFFIPAVIPGSSDWGGLRNALFQFNDEGTYGATASYYYSVDLFAIGTEIIMDCTLEFEEDPNTPLPVPAPEDTYNGLITVDNRRWQIGLHPFTAKFVLDGSGYRYKLYKVMNGQFATCIMRGDIIDKVKPRYHQMKFITDYTKYVY